MIYKASGTSPQRNSRFDATRQSVIRRSEAIEQEVEAFPEGAVPVAVQQQARAFDRRVAFPETCKALLRGGEALPAQTLVPVPKLAVDPMLFEVEAVVVLE